MENPGLTQPIRYQAYLIRLWQEDPTGPWRVALRHVLTNEELHFASLEKLFVYLLAQTHNDSDGSS